MAEAPVTQEPATQAPVVLVQPGKPIGKFCKKTFSKTVFVRNNL